MDDVLTCGLDKVRVQLEGHDRFRKISEESFHRARDRLRLELERVVEAERKGKNLTPKFENVWAGSLV